MNTEERIAGTDYPIKGLGITKNYEVKKLMRDSYAKGYDEGLRAYRVPMGVSQWVNHGKKYRYWDFFLEEAIKDLRQQIGLLRQLVAETDMTKDDIYKELNKIVPLFSEETKKKLKDQIIGEMK